jgi:hypothetical protein
MESTVQLCVVNCLAATCEVSETVFVDDDRD